MKAIGKPLTLVTEEVEYDPQIGFGVRYVYVGTKKAIYSKASVFQLAGWRYNVTNEGPTWTLNGFVNGQPVNNPIAEVPIDRWEINAEFYQDTIWNNPWVYDAARLVSGDPSGGGLSTDDVLALWRSNCEDALKGTSVASGQSLTRMLKPSETGFTEPLLGLYTIITRGQDAYETRRALLVRVRTISVQYSPQFVMPGVEVVYTTAQLVSTFLIPLAIALRLPDYPTSNNPVAAPTYAIWAWKQRRLASQIILAQNKVEETTEWVYAAWSRVTYAVIE